MFAKDPVASTRLAAIAPAITPKTGRPRASEVSSRQIKLGFTTMERQTYLQCRQNQRAFLQDPRRTSFRTRATHAPRGTQKVCAGSEANPGAPAWRRRYNQWLEKKKSNNPFLVSFTAAPVGRRRLPLPPEKQAATFINPRGSFRSYLGISSLLKDTCNLQGPRTEPTTFILLNLSRDGDDHNHDNNCSAK